MNVKEYTKIIPPKLCDEIISKSKNRSMYIPKHSNEWLKIETYLYKQLLLHVKKFRDDIFNYNNQDDYLIQLNKDMKLNSFHVLNYFNDEIKKVENYDKSLSRFNVLTFIYYLNDIPDFNSLIIGDGKNKINIFPEKGKLLLFQETVNYNYEYKVPDKNFSIITGQIMLKNIS